MRPSSSSYHHCRDIRMITSPRVAKFSYTVKLVISYIFSVSYLHYFSEVPSNKHVQLHRQQHHAQDLKKRHKFTSLIKIGKNGTLIVFRYPGRRLRFTFWPTRPKIGIFGPPRSKLEKFWLWFNYVQTFRLKKSSLFRPKENGTRGNNFEHNLPRKNGLTEFSQVVFPTEEKQFDRVRPRIIFDQKY